MRPDSCANCGTPLPVGSLKYIVRIGITADNDNVITEELSDEELIGMISEIERAVPKELEDDVHKEIFFVLCKTCRDYFAADPLQRGLKGNSTLLH